MLSAEEKRWLGDGQTKATAPELSQRYILPISTLYNYSRRDWSNVHSFAGHPVDIHPGDPVRLWRAARSSGVSTQHRNSCNDDKLESFEL